MSATSIVRQWQRVVSTQLLPDLHGHLRTALAEFSYAMVAAGHCQAGRIAVHVPRKVQPASCCRRFERLLANEHLDPERPPEQWYRNLLAHWDGGTAVLILDETSKWQELRALCLRVAYAHRALPLAMVCYPPDQPPKPMPDLVRDLLEQVHRNLPKNIRIVLLADRGLAWPVLVDWCTEHGWHYVLRLQGQTRVVLPRGRECMARDLARRVGQRWWGPAEVFKKAGWRGANVVATWERDMKEPWLLLTDQKASLRHCRTYGKRMWTEESFRDDKSSGFHWEQSHVNDPVHAWRLLLVMALAMVLAAVIGSSAEENGQRRALDPHRRRRLSVIQLGLRWLHHLIAQGVQYLPCLKNFHLVPT